MERYEAKAIVDTVLPKLLQALQLQKWTINIHYKHLGQNAMSDASFNTVLANCFSDPRYEEATFELDYAEIDDREELVKILRHELLHLFHADLNLYRKQVSHLVSDETNNVLNEAYYAAVEKTVRNLENMLNHGLGLDADGMVELSKTHYANLQKEGESK